MDPDQKDLFNALIDHVKGGRWVELLVYLGVLYFPALLAWISGWQKDNKIEALYEERLTDRKTEIDRQAARIKELENVLLRTPRR